MLCHQSYMWQGGATAISYGVAGLGRQCSQRLLWFACLFLFGVRVWPSRPLAIIDNNGYVDR